MVSNWSLSDNKSLRVARTLLSILADLNNAVVWMFSTRHVISKSSSPCTNPLMTVPRSPIKIGIIVTFMFHSFLNSLARSRYLFHSVVHWDGKVHNSASSLFFGFFFFFFFFLLIIIRSGRLADICWSVCISKSQKSLCVPFSRTDSGLCIYHLFVWSNFNFLHNSQWITLPTQSCLVLYSFCANLQLSRIMWLTYICCLVTSYLFSLWYD